MGPRLAAGGAGGGGRRGKASYRLLAVGLLCDLGHIAALSGSWTPCLPHRGLEIVGRHVGEREQRTVPVDKGSVVTFGAGLWAGGGICRAEDETWKAVMPGAFTGKDI